jgi:ribosomal protein S27AE
MFNNRIYYTIPMSNQTTQQYKKQCSRCASEILMANISGKWKAMETDGSIVHQCGGSGNNSSNTQHQQQQKQQEIKPEIKRPIAFTAMNSSNNGSNGNEQLQEQQPIQQQQQAQVYPYSVKIEQDSKGKAKVSIHVYGIDADTTKDEAIRLFVKTQDGLKDRDIAVLESTTKEEEGSVI